LRRSKEMRCEILYQPSYSLAVIQVEPGREIQAEAGAMVSMSDNIELQTEMKGGFLGALGRSVLGGESFFTSKYRARGGVGELTLAPALPGDMALLSLNGETVYLQSGAFVAGDAELTIDAKWGGARGFFSGGGLFLLRVQGYGDVLFAAYGALHQKELAPGERYIVDTGHVVAFTDGMGFTIRAAAQSRFASIASGEGLVCEFTGPGRIYIQTRSEEAFSSWVKAKLPKRSN